MIERIRGILISIQFLFSVSIVIVLMYLFNKHNRKIRIVWAKLQLKLMGVTLKEHGVLDNDAGMLMMNHQSMLDIILFEAIGKRDIAWVAKKEIADLFWFGHILKAPKMIIVERESKKSLVQLMKEAKARINDKRQLAIFPEGTRSDGTTMGSFKGGAKMIAERNNLRVQPIIIIGSHNVLKSKEMKQSSGQIDIIYLPTIEAKKDTQWFEKSEAIMRETFYRNLDKSEQK